MAREHLTCDLCVARLIGANKTDDRQAGEEQECAERNERQNVGRATSALLEAA
jgi:hypothetical protein